MGILPPPKYPRVVKKPPKNLTFSTTSVLLLLNVPLSLSRGTGKVNIILCRGVGRSTSPTGDTVSRTAPARRPCSYGHPPRPPRRQIAPRRPVAGCQDTLRCYVGCWREPRCRHTLLSLLLIASMHSRNKSLTICFNYRCIPCQTETYYYKLLLVFWN